MYLLISSELGNKAILPWQWFKGRRCWWRDAARRCVLSREAALLGMGGVKGFRASLSPQQGHKEGGTRRKAEDCIISWNPGMGIWPMKSPILLPPKHKDIWGHADSPLLRNSKGVQTRNFPSRDAQDSLQPLKMDKIVLYAFSFGSRVYNMEGLFYNLCIVSIFKWWPKPLWGHSFPKISQWEH